MSEQAMQEQSAPIEYRTQDLTISVNVSDLEQAIRWYGETLGFEVEYRMDDIGWAELKTPFGAVNIGLARPRTSSPAARCRPLASPTSRRRERISSPSASRSTRRSTFREW